MLRKLYRSLWCYVMIASYLYEAMCIYKSGEHNKFIYKISSGWSASLLVAMKSNKILLSVLPVSLKQGAEDFRPQKVRLFWKVVTRRRLYIGSSMTWCKLTGAFTSVWFRFFSRFLLFFISEVLGFRSCKLCKEKVDTYKRGPSRSQGTIVKSS